MYFDIYYMCVIYTMNPILNDDVLRIIDSYTNIYCGWCNKRIVFYNNREFCKVHTHFFCDVYCAQWLLD